MVAFVTNTLEPEELQLYFSFKTTHCDNRYDMIDMVTAQKECWIWHEFLILINIIEDEL